MRPPSPFPSLPTTRRSHTPLLLTVHVYYEWEVSLGAAAAMMSNAAKDGAQFYYEAENGFDKLRLEEIILFTFSRGELLPFLFRSLYVSRFFSLILFFFYFFYFPCSGTSVRLSFFYGTV